MKKKSLLKPISIDFGLLLLRLAAGGSLLTHGWPKLQQVIAGNFKFADPIGIGEGSSLVLASFAEAICAFLIIIGLATRFAVIPAIIVMAVAFFIVHGADAYSVKELPLLYLGMFVTLFFTGPGKYSIDSRL